MMTIIGIAAWIIAMGVDAFDYFYTYSRAHEDWELDEIAMGVLIFFLMGTVYMVRHSLMLRREMERRLSVEASASWAAYHDALTRLPNRHFLQHFVADADREVGRGATASHGVFVMDLDGFKKVNDLLGHACGDALLIAVADRLRELLPSAVIVRMGGDEFIVIVDTAEVKDPLAAAHKIVARMADPFTVSTMRAQIGCCVGVACTPGDSERLADALHYADVALGEAKRNGRNNVVEFTPAMSARLEERADIEADLRKSIERRAVDLHFQPLFDLKSQTLRGFEAFARWRRPNGECVPAATLIEVAESIGLIVDLSDLLLRQACKAALLWPEELTLSFNVSRAQLVDKMMAARVLKVLQDTGLSPERLQLDVSEQALKGGVSEAILSSIEELRRAGVRVALDDFGTGFSNLTSLCRYGLDAIKIDHSFFATRGRRSGDRSVVEAVVRLGQGFGLAVTAEGIETEAQLEWLAKLGCEYGQGYLLSRPMPQQNIPAFLKAYTDPSGLR
ncbi:EAL domain-containing protein [Acuticoccus sp. 2012]|uniref:EAL domain-containing protein n=2 Tax=Acuticoccus mangrovi TaxID=2796142 RepID=A0A934INR5_9HYPH|nr:EAL domain-containing protein [Acuticoccus mangrovi]